MASRRPAIRSALVALAQGVSGVASVVQEERALERLALPAVVVRLDGERLHRVGIAATGATTERVAEASLVAVVSGTAPAADEQLDALLDALEQAVAADPTLGGACADCQPTAIELARDAADARYLSGRLALEITYTS